jgi:hypothetical protein
VQAWIPFGCRLVPTKCRHEKSKSCVPHSFPPLGVPKCLTKRQHCAGGPSISVLRRLRAIKLIVISCDKDTYDVPWAAHTRVLGAGGWGQTRVKVWVWVQETELNRTGVQLCVAFCTRAWTWNNLEPKKGTSCGCTFII